MGKGNCPEDSGCRSKVSWDTGTGWWGKAELSVKGNTWKFLSYQLACKQGGPEMLHFCRWQELESKVQVIPAKSWDNYSPLWSLFEYHSHQVCVLLGSVCASTLDKSGVPGCPRPWGVSTTNVTFCSAVKERGQHHSHSMHQPHLG